MSKFNAKIPFLLADDRLDDKKIKIFNSQNGTNLNLSQIKDIYSWVIWKILKNKNWNS